MIRVLVILPRRWEWHKYDIDLQEISHRILERGHHRDHCHGGSDDRFLERGLVFPGSGNFRDNSVYYGRCSCLYAACFEEAFQRSIAPLL